ncbi:MAG: GNAT family N-acetyltransferase [Rudaea sp.]
MYREPIPLKPVTLVGRWVRLVPLEENHAADLFAASQDEEIWPYLLYDMPRRMQDMQEQIRDTLQRQARGQVLPFAIVEQASGRAIGSTSYLDISMHDRHVEIGSTWLGRASQRTAVNTECKYLLMAHAFETLGCIRVQLKTDLRNVRSQRAIERIGAVREGVLRKHMVVKGGYPRSTVYYSVVDDEWPAVKSRLERMLESAPHEQRNSV